MIQKEYYIFENRNLSQLMAIRPNYRLGDFLFRWTRPPARCHLFACFIWTKVTTTTNRPPVSYCDEALWLLVSENLWSHPSDFDHFYRLTSMGTLKARLKARLFKRLHHRWDATESVRRIRLQGWCHWSVSQGLHLMYLKNTLLLTSINNYLLK